MAAVTNKQTKTAKKDDIISDSEDEDD